MATRPTVKPKPWHQPEKKQHERVKDMRWFYNSRKWRKFSKQYKLDNPYCLECEAEGIVKAARVTDHIKTFEQCPEGFDLDNLDAKFMQPLCKKHHDSKSGRESQKTKIIKGYGVKSIGIK